MSAWRADTLARDPDELEETRSQPLTPREAFRSP
jgi:hypothetical protein